MAALQRQARRQVGVRSARERSGLSPSHERQVLYLLRPISCSGRAIPGTWHGCGGGDKPPVVLSVEAGVGVTAGGRPQGCLPCEGARPYPGRRAVTPAAAWPPLFLLPLCCSHLGSEPSRKQGEDRQPLHPLPFLQDPQEPGFCRIHTGSKAPKRAETSPSEVVVPGGQRPVSAPQGLAPPAAGGCPGTARRGQGDLQCPHCLQCFSDEQGEELFRHVAECCL